MSLDSVKQIAQLQNEVMRLKATPHSPTAWTEWTPTVDAFSPMGIASASKVTAQYCVFGPMLFFRLCYNPIATNGSPGAAITFSVPSGYTIDSFMTASGVLYDGVWGNASVQDSDAGHIAVFNSDSVVNLSISPTTITTLPVTLTLSPTQIISGFHNWSIGSGKQIYLSGFFGWA